MAPQQRVPGKGELKRYLNAGMTQAQIVDAWEEESGYRVSRSAIGMAISRYGLKSAHERPEYPELLPWTVAEEHKYHNDARMLRLEGRLRSKGEEALSEPELRWLNGWKADLDRMNAVVYYDRQNGFVWIEREPKHTDLIDPPDPVPAK